MIKFTFEVEDQSGLSFLDLKIKRSDNKLYFDIFRKPAATDHVIPYQSAHPLNHKLSVFHSLFNRAFSIPLNNASFIREINTIKAIANNNGFPDHLINKLYHKTKNKMITKRLTSLRSNTKREMKYFSLPYVPQLSERISYTLKKYNICISHKVRHKINNF